MTCESCGSKFGFLKKKNKCHECLKEFCSSCMWREKILLPRQAMCRTCHTLTSMPLDRSELMHLRVRELQHFLMMRNVPVHTCTEKRDLVDLVVRWAARPAQSSQTSSGQMPANRTNSPNATQETTYPSETTASSQQAPDIHPEQESSEGSGDGDKKLCKEDLLYLDIDELSIRQLKEILSRSFVTYRGCCEKAELIDKVKRLQEEARSNHARLMQGLPEESICKICMDAPIDCVFLECGHMLSCTKCGQVLSECPVCRQYIVRVVHTFRA